MHPKLFFPLPILKSENKTESNPNSTDQEHKTMTDKPKFLKNLDLFKFRRIAGKRTSKLPSNHKKPHHFNSTCNWISKGIWALSLTFSSNMCFAATADGYAFTGALFNIMNELKGAPIAIITALGIIAGGFYWAFKGHDVGLKQVVSALVGGGLVIAAPTLISMIPGITGATI